MDVYEPLLPGHPYQGAVVLVLLSDWAPGGGGTAFVRGSHRWVAGQIAAREPAGVIHQDLNAWAIQTVAVWGCTAFCTAVASR
jgi:hypothetical protein